MRVAVVHSYYRSAAPSGENRIVDAQVQGLRARGHQVGLFARHSDDLGLSIGRQLLVGLRVATWNGADLSSGLAKFRPDVIHIHNLFPNIGTAWLSEVDAPIAATLHNFRAVCANGYMFRNGAFCDLCVKRGSLQAVRHACYRDSHIASVPLAVRTRGGLNKDPVVAAARVLIAPSERLRELYIRLGVSPSRIRVVLNGVQDRVNYHSLDRRPGFVFVGRLSPEKGVLQLLDAWPGDKRLDVIGDGPLLPEVQKLAKGRPEIRILGARDPESLMRLYPQYEGVVIPSRWAEAGVTLVLAEAMMSGVPVLAREGSSAADFVSEFGGGLTYDSDHSLVQRLSTWPSTIAPEPRALFEEHLSQDRWLANLENIYEQVS